VLSGNGFDLAPAPSTPDEPVGACVICDVRTPRFYRCEHCSQAICYSCFEKPESGCFFCEHCNFHSCPRCGVEDEAARAVAQLTNSCDAHMYRVVLEMIITGRADRRHVDKAVAELGVVDVSEKELSPIQLSIHAGKLDFWVGEAIKSLKRAQGRRF